MKKIIGMLFAALLFLFVGSVPVFGQHRGGQGHGQGHGGGRIGAPVHGPHGESRGFARGHYDGRHFDEGFRGAYFGRDHFFRVGGPVLYGGRWGCWYGGVFWGWDLWPVGWAYTDPVYIDMDGDSYFLYNPYHPGVHIALGVAF